MPEREVIERAQRDLDRGESPSTAAGEFVREEMHHIREGKHGASSTKQAIAIGLSKARRAGVPLQPPKGTASKETRQSAANAKKAGQSRRRKPPSPARAKATRKALKRKPTRAASHAALSRHAKQSARQRGRRARQASARKAAQTRKRG